MTRAVAAVLVATALGLAAATVWVPCRGPFAWYETMPPPLPPPTPDLRWFPLWRDPHLSEGWPPVFGNPLALWEPDAALWAGQVLAVAALGGILGVGLRMRAKHHRTAP